MSAGDIRRQAAKILSLIEREGGHYITPEGNRQPIPALRIASIRVGDLVGIGGTEAEAQADFIAQWDAAVRRAAP